MDREYKQVRVSDLPDLCGKDMFPRPFLSCAECGAEFSAHKGDYFMHRSDHTFTCCGENMALMTKRVVYEEWSPKKT